MQSRLTLDAAASIAAPRSRPIVQRTRGHNAGGPINRLMSPSDLGQYLKPFVFLDIFEAKGAAIGVMTDMPLHPHSGIATVTVFTKGRVRYEDPTQGSGEIGYGGVEWMRAGRGVWHGKEMVPAAGVSHIQGFQLWLALPEQLELAEPQSHYVESHYMVQNGPATVVIGTYNGVQGPIDAPAGLNYLLITLRPGERWSYKPPLGHRVAWLAVAGGALDAGAVVGPGEMVVFADDGAPIDLRVHGDEDAVFVLGSAVPHPHPLVMGYYSVHTSAQALAAGEERISELGQKLKGAGNRETGSGTVPVFK